MKLQNLLLVTLTSMALLSCNDSDDGIETPAAQVKKAVVTINIKGNTITRALSEEVPGTGNENDIKSLEFFVFNGDGSFQKYFKPEAPAANSQYTFLVDAGNLTILAAVNQNLGEPSTTPISLADFKNTCSLYSTSIERFQFSGRHRCIYRLCYGSRRFCQCN